MSGTSIPYHLRQNKAIDRFAFIDLLFKIHRIQDISQYTYIGFGGHSLEDFKYIHNQFEMSKMISIEESEQVYERQKFNQPISCIELVLTDSKSFINGFNRTEKTIIWLDYTKPKELLNQIHELQAILQSLSTFDIVKITLNANPTALGDPGRISSDELKQFRLDKLRERLGELYPASQNSELLEFMTRQHYPRALCLILELAVNLALEGLDCYFQPLTIFSYTDGQQMLTVTGILLEDGGESDFFERTGIKSWQLSNTTWGAPQRIDIPDFTIKERLWIDSLLPGASAEELHEELDFWFDESKQKSLDLLKTYMLFYRRSPLFTKILV